MIVVADTSPVNYIVQLQLPHLLRQLYGEVVVPPAVVSELKHRSAPETVRKWVDQLPEWMLVQAPRIDPDPATERLGAGEREALALALELRAGTLLVDERKARHIALTQYSIEVTGTLGVLRDAHHAGFVDGLQAFHALCTKTTFRSTPAVERAFADQLKR